MSFIYPPRPEVKCSPDQLGKYTNGYVGQPKLNGSCSVLYLDGASSILYERHNSMLTNTKELGFSRLHQGSGYMTLVGEYMNKNKKGVGGVDFNHKFVIFDILAYNGKTLVGSTTAERLDMLENLYGTAEMAVSPNGLVTADNFLYLTEFENIFRVKTFMPDADAGWERLYYDLIQHDMYEGLVLKRIGAKLEAGLREANNTGWQVKCRKETKIYKF